MDNLKTLKEIVSKSGNCVNLGRSLIVKNLQLFEWVNNNTQFLPADCKFTERVYCIVNSICTRVYNGDGETYARFVNMFEGYCVKSVPIIKPVKQPALAKPKKSKLQSFIDRNLIRNATLYSDNAVLGDDYIICPESNARLIIIRADYITKVLGMTVDEYDIKYPNTQKKSQAHSRNISEGVNKIDPTTGLTKSQIGSTKAHATLRQIGADGTSGYQKLGEKTRATHLKNIDEFGRNGYTRQVHARTTTILQSGLTVEQTAHIKQKETLLNNHITGTGGASKLSKRVLSPILEYLQENDIHYYFDRTEYAVKDTDLNKYYFFDLTIPKFDMAIEYQSSAWHADPTLPLNEWNNWKPPLGDAKSADEVLMYDYDKARALWKFRKMTTYYVWQKTQDTDVKELLCLLKTLNTKY